MINVRKSQGHFNGKFTLISKFLHSQLNQSRYPSTGIPPLKETTIRITIPSSQHSTNRPYARRPKNRLCIEQQITFLAFIYIHIDTYTYINTYITYKNDEICFQIANKLRHPLKRLSCVMCCAGASLALFPDSGYVCVLAVASLDQDPSRLI